MWPKIKVLALQRESLVAPGVPSLSAAARITEVLEYLGSAGEIEYAIIDEKDTTAAKGVNWADVIILSKHCSKPVVALARYARDRGSSIIYDLDDWIFSFPKYSGGQVHEKQIKLILEIMSISNVVTVANPTLLQKIRSIVQYPILLPNGIWVEKYINHDIDSEFAEADPPRIVFTNADFLKMKSAKETLLTALQIFFLNHPEFILDFYGDPFPEIFSLPFLHFTNRMPYADYLQALASGRYQFAIIPLGGDEDMEESEFNSCKNPFKYLNYGATKVPGIYSRAQIYEDSVRDGETGIIIDNDLHAWLGALEMMANNRKLRRSISTAAFKDVMENYHIKISAEVLKQVLSTLC